MKKIKEMNGNEKIAYRNTKYAIDWIVGGYYNSLQDGYIEDLPNSLRELKDEIYQAAMSDGYGIGIVSFGGAPKEMRFAGGEFIREIINKIDNDPDVKEMIKEARWEN